MASLVSELEDLESHQLRRAEDAWRALKPRLEPKTRAQRKAMLEEVAREWTAGDRGAD